MDGEQVQDLDAVVIPVGGAGLIAGLSRSLTNPRPAAPLSATSCRIARTPVTTASLTFGGVRGMRGVLTLSHSRSHVPAVAGMALAIKSLRPDIEIIGVEPAYCASYSAALKTGKPVPVSVSPTLGDGAHAPCYTACADILTGMC